MQRAVVTGASGFIGGHLVEELIRREVPVKCLVRPTSSVDDLRHPLVETISCRLHEVETVRKAISEADVVFHVAGLTCARTNQELFNVNQRATASVVEGCCASSKPPRFIYLSSAAAAGPPPLGKKIRDETDPPMPISSYGRSKRQAEIVVQSRASDFPCTVIRPGVVFGPRDKAMVQMIRPIFRTHVHVVVGFRTPPLSLIYVKDLVRLMVHAAEQGECLEATPGGECAPQGYYFACDDSEYPDYRELGERFASALNRRVLVWPLWHWVARTVAAVNQFSHQARGKATLLNLDKMREATAKSWRCSSDKARRQLQFSASSDLNSLLRDTATWYLEHGWL